MESFRRLDIEDQIEFFGWLALHLFHFLDSDWMFEQDWSGVAAQNVFTLRLLVGHEAFTPYVTSAIAAAQSDEKERIVIGLFHLPDDEFIHEAEKQSEAGKGIPEDLLEGKGMGIFIEMRQGLQDAWLNSGLIEPA